MSSFWAVALALLAISAAGDNCQAGQCDQLAGVEEDETLQLLQRRARSKELFPATQISASALFHELNQNATRLAASLATRALEASSTLKTDLGASLPQPPHRLAAVSICLWVATVGGLLSYMISSVLGPLERSKCEDRHVTLEPKKEKKEVDLVWSVSPFTCLSFTWLDRFLHDTGFFTAGDQGVAVRPLVADPKSSIWDLLRRCVPHPMILFSCGCLVAFFELVGLVLIFDVLLQMGEDEQVRLAQRNEQSSPVRVTLKVLLLLFVLPVLYRYFSSLLSMLDGFAVTSLLDHLAHMVYQKATRLPIGSSYGARSAAAKTLVEGLAQEWPLLFRSLAVATGAPVMAGLLVAFYVFHMHGQPLCWAFVLPGLLIGGLLVKLAIAKRKEYQLWQLERQRWQGIVQLSSSTLRGLGAEAAVREKIRNARERELVANQWYSIMMGMLAANLQSIVWLMVVCSLYLTAHRGSLEAHPRNIWLTLQVMTSLSAALASFLAGLRKGAVLFPSLKRVDCFLQQPEMPREVVRLPFSTGPVARISGSFSFEEGGRMALRDLDLSLSRGEVVALLGPPCCGKSAVLLALLGELFPCGLACVSSSSSRCYIKGPGAKIPQDTSNIDLLIWDDADEERLPRGCASLVTLRLEDAGRGHALARGARAVDRVVLLQQGRMVLQGPPEEVLRSAVFAAMSKHDAVPETTVMKSDVQALVPPAPLRVLGDALLRATREGPSFSARPHQDEGDLWTLGTSYVNSAFWGTALTLFLVLLQRGTQLLQLLLLATWGDQAMLGHCDHGSFARNLAIAVLLNALFFTLSEWAASRLARRQRTAPDVDSLVVSSWLACVRSCCGSFLQQAYILLVAPQWLALFVLLPVYVCIYFFASIYLRAAVALASRGEESFQELQEVMSKSLEPDPVCLRGNHLQNHFGHRFDLLLRTMTRSRNALPACIKSWLHFRVTFCLSFAAAACALEVLLCAERSHVGVGSLGLVISLLLALAGDLEVSCDSAVQGCVALKTASRISRKGEALLVLDSPETAEEAPEIQEDGLDVEALLKASGRSGLGGVGVPGEVEVALPSETYAKIERLSKSFPLVTQDPALWDGTWHENLDPGRRWPEERVWAALRGVGLAPLLEDLAEPLPSLALYQRQLLGLARHQLHRGDVVPIAEALHPLAMEALEQLQTESVLAKATPTDSSSTK